MYIGAGKMNTYNWSIVKMVCNSEQNNQSNVVVRALWKCEASDGTNTVMKSEFCNIPFNSNGTFIDYANLTENEVLSWVWTVTNKGEIESKLDQALLNRTMTLTSPPLPWN